MIGAEGRYYEGEDEETADEKRAAIFIGPEFGTVSRPDLVEAAREAAVIAAAAGAAGNVEPATPSSQEHTGSRAHTASHARTHERNESDFPVGLTPQPPI